MLDRYDGYVAPVGAGRWPGRVMLVDVRSRSVPQSTSGCVVRERLSSWHITILRSQKGVYKVSSEQAGYGRGGFWSVIDQLAHGRGIVWVVCTDATRVWPLLGFWEELENGRTYLGRWAAGETWYDDRQLSAMSGDAGGSSGSISAGALSRVWSRRNGYLVTTDCIAICKCWRSAGPATFRWLDTSNWGVSWPDQLPPGPGRLSCMVAWWTATVSMCRAHRLGALQATAATTAFHAYCYSGITHLLYAHEYPAVQKLEAEAYCGGRCEAFQLGKIEQPVWHYDFRSLYPWVCTSWALPTQLVSHRVLDGTRDPPVGQNLACCLARVTIRTDEPDYPVHHGGDVIYPIGTFITTLAGPELLDAFSLGRIVTWHEVASYECQPALSSYVGRLYELRCWAEQQGSAQMAQFAKALLVSLCGRFGQKLWSWVPCPDVWCDVAYGIWTGAGPDGVPCTYRAMAGNVTREEERGFAPGAVPALAAWITSAGRMRLLRALRMAGRDNCYYVDTDSAFVNETGAMLLHESGLVIAGQLGYLQLKSEEAELEVRGIKYYIENGKVTCAGLPDGSVQDEGGSQVYWRPVGARASARKGQRPEAIRYQSSYQRVAEYRHGQVMDNGRVQPLILGG